MQKVNLIKLKEDFDLFFINNENKKNFEEFFKDSTFALFEDKKLYIFSPLFSKKSIQKFILENYQDLIFRFFKSKNFKLDNFYLIHSEKELNLLLQNSSRNKVEKTQSIKFKNNDFGIKNKNYTFDNFFKSTFNELALEVLKDSLNETGEFNNIYFLCGKSGSGKSHLLSAIANEAKKQNKSCVYIQPALFSNKITQVLFENNSLTKQELSNFFVNDDVVLFDDFDDYGEGKKKGTKNFILNIIENRINLNKLTIIASKTEYKKLKSLFDEKLFNRLGSGIKVSIESPKLSERKSFLQFLNPKLFEVLDEQSIEFILFNTSNSNWNLIQIVNNLKIRMKFLEGFQNKVEFIRSLLDQDVKTKEEINIDLIISKVSKFFGISKKEIKSKSRKLSVSWARHICVYLDKKLLNKSLNEIGRDFNMDHSSVIYIIRKVNEKMKNLEKKSEINSIINKIHEN